MDAETRPGPQSLVVYDRHANKVRTFSRRRWLQVSLRTFLVLMLLVSIGLGWLGTAIQRGRERRNAVLAIIELGGNVSYQEPSNFLQRSDWLRKSLGDELLLDVESVSLTYPRNSDADLVHLKGLTKLKTLGLHYTQVSDAGLVHLCSINPRHTDLDGITARRQPVTQACHDPRA